jgi:hypothetical protein
MAVAFVGRLHSLFGFVRRFVCMNGVCVISPRLYLLFLYCFASSVESPLYSTTSSWHSLFGALSLKDFASSWRFG